MLFLEAKAKINFGLDIISRREDGYHNIRSVFLPLKFSDEIIIDKSSYFDFQVEGDVPSNEDNTVYKAVALFFGLLKEKPKIKLKLKKNIPAGAGLGGGSSDAAYTLIGLNKLYGDPFSYEDLKNMALKIGMDVVFFLKSKPGLVEGKGDKITEIEFGRYPVLLVFSDIIISTAWAYKRFDDLGRRLTNHIKFIKIIERENKKGLSSIEREEVWNVFESVVFEKYKILREMKDKIEKLGKDCIVMMTGTGSCFYLIDEDIEKIKFVKKKLGERSVITSVEWGVV